MADLRRYDSDAGLRRALNERLTATARDWGWTREQVRDAFVVQQFVARLARRDPDAWVLKGGSALQIRSPEARPTADADLAARRDRDDVLELLQSCSDPINEGERGRFAVEVTSERAGTYSGSIQWQLGGSEFWRAKIDVSFAQHVQWSPEIVAMSPMVSDIAGFAELPAIPIAPPEAHLADKVAAMVELHGPAKDRPSTRSHDLADIVILSRCVSVDAGKLRSAIDVQESLRGITVGSSLRIPAASWERDYARRLRTSSLPEGLRDVHGALTHANAFLEPVLSKSVTAGTWHPDQQRWVAATPSTAASVSSSPSVKTARDLLADTYPARGRSSTRAARPATTSSPGQERGNEVEKDISGPEL